MTSTHIAVVILVTLLALSATAALAQDDPCTVCWAEWGGACPCLPAAPEPPGGTIPPVAGIACIPQTNDIGGCDDKVYLPHVAR